MTTPMRRHPAIFDGHTARLAAVVILAALVVALLVWAVLPTDPKDLSVFLRAGSDVAAGRSPYVAPGTPALWSGSAFVYPWVMAWPFAALALLPQPVALAIFRLASIAAVAVGCRLAGCRRLLALLAVLGSSVAILGLQQGTLDALLFGGLVLAWRSRDRSSLLAPLLAVLVTSELFLWPLLIWALFTGRRRAAAGASVLSAALIGIGLLAGEPLPSYVRSLSQLSHHEGPHSSSLFALALQTGTSAIGASVLSVLIGLVVVGLAILAERRTGQTIGFAGAVCASLIATPILWSHYLLLLAVPLLIADVRPRTKMILLGLFDVVSWVRYTPYRSTWELDVLGLALALIVLAWAAWPLPSRRALMPRLRAQATRIPAGLYLLLGLICVLGFLAHERGVPIGVVQGSIVLVCFYVIAVGQGPEGTDVLGASIAARRDPPG